VALEECPVCHNQTMVVKNSRPHEYGRRRRKECTNPNCKYRYTTREIVVDAEDDVVGIKKDLRIALVSLREIEKVLIRAVGEDLPPRKPKSTLTPEERSLKELNELPIKFVEEQNNYGQSVQGAKRIVLHKGTQARSAVDNGKVPRK
jgi:hypothetical protein